MIFLRRNQPTITSAQQAALKRHSVNAAKLQPGDSRIGPRWSHFRAGETMAGVCDVFYSDLRKMAHEKCALCETQDPKTIEHIDEKTLYPGKMFDWLNLLPACNDCNTARMQAKITTRPLDPSSVDPLLCYSWSELGCIAPLPAHCALVDATERSYNLARFNAERSKRRKFFLYVLACVWKQSPVEEDTRNMLMELLDKQSMFLGPIRDIILRPQTSEHRELVYTCFRKLPELRSVVAPWLNPPPSHPPPWDWPEPE